MSKQNLDSIVEAVEALGLTDHELVILVERLGDQAGVPVIGWSRTNVTETYASRKADEDGGDEDDYTLTDEQWNTIRSTGAWEKMIDTLADAGGEVIDEALWDAGIR